MELCLARFDHYSKVGPAEAALSTTPGVFDDFVQPPPMGIDQGP